MNDTFNETVQDVSFDDDWDDVDLSDLTDNNAADTDDDEPEHQAEQAEAQPAEAEPKADQPTEEPAEGQQTEGQPEQQPDADQRFELKHLDERREVTLDEMKTLAQKGMDYDRIRQERDEMREGYEFLKELAGDKSVDQLIDETRAVKLAEQQGIDRQTALERVKLERDRKAFEAQKAAADAERTAAEQTEAQQAAHEQWRRDCFLAFSREFPEVRPDSIPKDVWTAFQNGETLVSAYRGYKLKELQNEIQNKQQAEDAAKRSTGSRQSAGTNEQDEFDRLWYDDD